MVFLNIPQETEELRYIKSYCIFVLKLSFNCFFDFLIEHLRVGGYKGLKDV